MKFLRRSAHVASIVTLLLAFAACATAQSQPRQPQSRAAGAQQPAAPDPRGTDGAPLIIKIEPTPKTDAEATEEQRKKQQEADDRWWTRRLAVFTGVVGLLQLVAIGFQVGIARRQNRLFGQQNGIMETQSTIMNNQLIETQNAAAAAKLSADTAHASFLMGSAVSMSISDLKVRMLKRIATGERMIRIAYRIHNASKNPAFVIQWGGFARIDRPSGISTGDDVTVAVAETFAPGKGLHFPLDTLPLTADDLANWDNNSLVVRTEVWVRVSDPQGNETTHRFRRLVITGVNGKAQSMQWSGGHDHEIT